MATMTIAQALASNATGIIIADTPANIGAALSNAALVARVSQFTMNGNGAAWASLATQLASLGSKFSPNGHKLVIRDTVAMLTDPGYAAGVALGANYAVDDTAANLLAIAGTPLATNAASVLLSTSAGITLAQLITLEAEPSFSVTPGQSITLADSAPNLLALTAGENRPAIKAYSVTANSAVNLATAPTLFALPHLSVAAGATLSIADTVSAMTNPSVASALAGYAAVSGVTVTVADSLATLLAHANALTTLAQSVPGLTTAMTDFQILSAAQLIADGAALPHFGIAAGGGVELVDTAANLIALAPAATAPVVLTNLSQNATVNLAQIAALTALPNFSSNGHTLTVTDTLANLAGLTSDEATVASAVVVRDTVAHLLAAPSMPAGTTGVIALLDGTTYTAAQAEALLALADSLSLVASGSAATLLISDTTAHLTDASAALVALESDGPVTVTATDGGPLPGSVLTAAVAASLIISTAGLSVSDTGAALSAYAGQIFGRGFSSITVASGMFAGTEAQLLDPTLHFGSQSSGTPTGNLVLLSQLVTASAQLVGNTTASVAQLTAMSILPNFSLASGATLMVSDTISALAGASALVGTYATSVTATDSETVTAAGAAALAGIRSAVGAGNFSLGGHVVTVSDDAANIANAANAAGIALAGAVTLSVPSIVTAAQAASLLALGSAFSVNGMGLTIADTAAHLATLTGSATTLSGWGAQVQLSADATLSVVGAQALLGFTGFAVGTHHLTLSDNAANLLAGSAAAAESVASAVTLSQAATVTVAGANTLLGMHGFSASSQAVTIADTPAHLAAMTPTELALATTETIVARTLGNAADYTLSAAQLAALQAMPNLSMSGFVNPITLSDTAPALAALASAFSGAPSGSLLTHTVPVLSVNATVSASTANTLAHLPNFGLGGHTLTVLDTPANLVASGVVAGLAIASSVGIAAPATVSVAMANALAALPAFAADGNPLTIADTPAALLTLSSGVAALVANEQVVPYTNLNAAGFVLTAAQLQTLAAIPNLMLAGPITIQDTAANLILLEAVFAAASPGSALLAARGASSATLSADATVSAASLHALAALPGLSLGGHNLTISDTPTALLAAPPPDLGLANGVTLTAVGGPWTVSAGAAEALVSLPHFSAGTGLAVSDTVGNLLAPANAAGLAAASSVTIASDSIVTAWQAEALIGLANFQTNGTAPIAIADTLTHLLQLGSVSLPHNNAILLATSIGLSEDATATVAQMNALAALPEFPHFSLNGNALTVMDSGRHLAAYTPAAGATPTSIQMIGDASLSAAQANTLATLGVAIGDNSLTVADTPAALLNSANASGIALADALTLSGNATATAAQATTLFGNMLFTTGGHHLTIQDSAAALLGLSSDIDADATTLALAANETVSVATLLGLTEFGIKFSVNGYRLTVADTAPNLATLNTLETNLAASEVLNAGANVTAAAAETLAALPNFSRGSGITLTIVDTVAALSALSGAAQAIATGEQLAPGSSVTLTVAQAQGLSALSGFSNTGATIVVSDTIAHLGASGWQSVATSYDVTDSIANIVANAANNLETNAASVVLAGDSVIDTTAIDTLAGIAHFTRGTASLVVADSAEAIGAHAAEILAVASAARVISTGAVTAAQAEALVGLANAGKLTFAGSSHLNVTDTFANLSNASYADGVALAAVITVADTAVNLVAATSHDWGSVTPYYVLTAGGTIDGADATVLAGLGGHYGNGGFVLTVADTAAEVVANGATLTSLGIEAAVADSIANIDVNVAGLVALGVHLVSVTPTDTSAVSADAAAGLHALVSVLAGSAIAVSDTASSIVADSTNLLALGAHLGTITLTDVSPVAVAVATGLLPLLSDLVGGTVVDVSDTGANIAAQASGLASLGADLGTIALSDGIATDAATAAALVPIASHLGTQTLTVSDTAAAIAAASAGLTTMEADSRIASITAPNETVAHVLAYGATLASLSAIATISDTAAQVNAALDGLEALAPVVTSIALNDGGTPTLDVTVAQLSGDNGVLAVIASPHDIVVSDTAAHIQADLASGSSAILGALASLTGIVANDAGTVTLTEAQVLAAGVDDGVGSAMALFSGGMLVVTGVAAADASTIAALGVPPASMSIFDTAANIQADLTSGSSELVAERALITAIAVGDSGTITLTEAQVTAAHIDDGAGSVFAKLTGGSLDVTGVTVAQIGTAASLPVAPTAIAVNDTAAHIQAGLIAGGAPILTHLSTIDSIVVSDAGTISLTVAQIEAAGVDDGAGSALGKMTGETLMVTGATVADIATLAGLTVVPSAFVVTDTAAHIQADLALGGGSNILTDIALLSGIAVNPAGTITLTEVEALHAEVDDGAGSALSLMTGETLVVTSVAVADIGTVLGLSVAPDHITVSGTASDIQADLASGSSALVGNIGSISGITVSDAGTVTLTVGQIEAAGVDDGAGSVLAKMSGGTVDVSGAAVADIATLLGLGVVPASIVISDSAADVDADLTSGFSVILANIGSIGSIALTNGGTPSLSFTLAQLASAEAALGLIATPYALAISDTAADIQADLASGSSSLMAHLTAISGITVSDAGTIVLTQAQVLAAHVDDGAGSVFSLLSGGTLDVTHVTTAAIGTVLGLGFAPSSIAVSDTAADIQADLISGSSAILGNLGSISGITVGDAGTISLTDAQIQAAGVDDGAGSALSLLSGGTVVATDVPIADIATMLALGVPPTSIAVSDTAADIQADLAGGSSLLVVDRAHISSILVNDSGTISLTVAQAEAAHVDDGAGSVFSKMTGETLEVTGALVSDVGNLGALIVQPTGLAISDTAAHIQADLTSGSSHLAANLSLIGAITVSDAGTITLTETQLRAAHVDDGANSVLALTSGGSLAVTHVLVADIRTIGGLTVVPDTFAITDTAAHIQADLMSGSSAILSYLGAIPSIAMSPAGTITLTEDQVLGASVDDGAGSALSKMTGLTLHVTDVPVSDIGTILALGVPPSSITVSDTAADIQADLTGGASAILANLSDIGGIVVSDAGAIGLTVAQAETAHIDDGAGSVFAKLTGGTLTVTDAAVSDIATLTSLGVPPTEIEVSDTAAHIQADLASGSSHILAHIGRIDTIAVNDSGTITLTETQLRAAHVDDGAGSALAKMTGETLAVTQVLAADVGIVAALGVAPSSIAVSDTAAHIQADLASGSSNILTNIGLISGIAVNPAGTITLTETQLEAAGVDDGAGSALALMTGETLTVTHVLAADIGTIAALGVPPDNIAVTDTAANIQADLASGSSEILANLGSISAIAVSPAGTVTLTDAQVQATGVDDGAGSALALMFGETLVVTGVPVADIAAIMGLGVPPAHIIVVDSEANIVADLTSGSSVIAANSSAIASVTPTDASLDVNDAAALYNALLGVATLVESGLTITGTAADLLSAENLVPAMLSAAEAVTMTDDPTGLTAAQATTLSGILGGHLANAQTLGVVDTVTNLLSADNAAGIALATDVALNVPVTTTAATATLLAGLHAFDAGAEAITVSDSVANLLNASNAAGLAVATTVEPNTDVTVSASQLSSLAAIAGFATGGHNIVVGGTAAAIAGLSQVALDFTSLASVSDTAADVSTSLNILQSVVTGHGHALSIDLTDAIANTIAVTVTAATYTADQAVLDAIATNGVVEVTGTAAQLAALSSTLAADAVVGEVAVTDSAANILSNLTALDAIGSKFGSATVTDATLNASAVSGLLTIPNLMAGSLTISDTGAQLAAAIQANGSPGLAFLNAHTVTLSADSVVTASQALSLESLTGLNKNGHTLVAWDTASHLIDSIDGYLAAVSAGSIDGVYLKTIGGTATVSAATAAALFSIPNFSKNNPDATTNLLTVQDTAAHLESAFTSLNAHKTAVSGIVVSASTTVTDAVYGDLLTLGATTAFGANVTVRDTAANIVAHAPTQLSASPSLTPTAWALSGSATVNIAGAAFLGGLSGFSPGAFTLTLGADGSASVSDANNLGALGATLHLGGHHVHVAGTVATVSALTNAAKLIATPDITDTFAHIATLAIGDGLLGGSITVTDSGSPTMAQASAFLAILLANGNGGIPIANVSFGGHSEAITDTLANIQTLTGSAGWTTNASVHADFSLVVADTVATLINGANTAALSAMAGTTLSCNQTATAANAESLFAVENTINFTLGGHTITIQDTAANILNLANADGEALASAWQLSGNDTVAAADAETLLTASKFSVNGYTLTISDSSDNLLDGVLSGDISGFSGVSHVHVQLAGAETLDAQTAAALVALPGFTNNGDLSIQDSSDYLLNSANHTAEADAASVTLVGDETVSVATATALAAVPNFALGSSHLYLASNDYANAAALVAIGNFDTGFDANGHTLTMTQDALNLTPSEYNALQSDNIVLNGHALSALATGVVVTSDAGTVHVAGNGVDGATLNVYASGGASLSQTAGVAASFTANASEGSIGNGVVVTETVGASAATSESAPIIALEQTVITGAVTGASATFAGSGSVQVATGEYLNLYTTANAPASPANPDLVYDATAHTLSLDIAGHSPLVLVTLGGATHPTSLDPSEIIVQHFN